MTTPIADDKLPELEALLAPDEPGLWINHGGDGRPNNPMDYVEVEWRDGRTAEADSAVFCWPWAEPEDDDAWRDIVRWRPRKRPANLRNLGAHVPSLLARIRSDQQERAELEARVRKLEDGLRPFAEAADRIGNPHANDRNSVASSPFEKVSGPLTYGDLRRARTLLNIGDHQ